MKFRISRSGRKIISKAKTKKKISFAGRNTLKLIKPLPAISPSKEITAATNPDGKKKKFSSKPLLDFKKIFFRVRSLACQIVKELGLAYKRLVSLVDRHLVRAKAKKSKRQKGPFMLMGAASASALLTVSVLFILTLGLFVPHARGYEVVTVPSFVGASPDETEFDRDMINIIIKYENNPDVENGAVISQSPRAGVTRRVYKNGEFCNVHLTVSRHERVAVPDGIVGASLRDASLLLMNNGLQYEVKEKFSLGAKDGTVLSSYPKSGEMIKTGEKVILSVSG